MARSILLGSVAASAAIAQEAPAPTGEDNAEIVVTAAKRSERVRDISASVTAFDEASLENIGARSFADYLTRTPGVVFNQTVPGNSTAIIRGVATTTGIAQAQGTTGYFINDVPMTDPFYSGGIPDLDTFDVNNVAVLRGPQGTLFGSASLGGAINYEARRPDLNSVGVHVRGTIESMAHGDDGYSANAMVNLPIVNDVLAVRGVLTHRSIGGFVDNIGTGDDNSNRTTINGGRIQATLRPADGTTFNYLFLRQVEKTRDAGGVESDLGTFEKSTLIPEPFRYETNIHNLRLDQDVGFATLIATATHRKKEFSGTQDFSTFAGGLLLPYAPVAFLEPGTIKGDSFEVRLASPAGQRFEYVVGLFHDRTSEAVINRLDAPAAVGDFGSSVLLDALVDIDGKESAIFGEGSYRFSDAFKITAGGRLFHTELESTTTQGGPLVGPTTVEKGGSRETGFSPKVALTWTPNEDVMVYGLASKGFRFGGPNIATDPVFPIPSQFDSDSLWNYEIGARLTLADGRLLLDGTVYWVNWSDIQVTQTSPSGFTYTANAGKARNRGFEAGLTWRPVRDLSVQSSVTYLDGELRRDFLSGAGLVPSGSRLPGASRWQTATSISYDARQTKYQPNFSLSHRYVSKAPGELTPSPEMQGGYHLLDARAGAKLGHFEATLFLENIGDVRGISQATSGLVRGPIDYYVRPRTVGLTLDYRL
jgi:outer membrane receptor protein involved in Fe transport